MSRPIWRALTALTVLAVLATACGNSKGEGSSGADTTVPASAGAPKKGTGTDADRDTFKPISGVPGVSDDKIVYDVIATKSNNPLGNCILDCYLDGIEAYFAYRNSEGGIFKRKLTVGQVLDDELGQNQVRSLDVISNKAAFGVFDAALLATGWGDLDKAGIPTYAWGINATEAANRSHIFPSVPITCEDCTRRGVPYAVELAGAKKVASLGYGISENSKRCAVAVADSIKLYSDDIGADLVYTEPNLKFGLPNGIGPEVTAMKRAGVDFISTCIDLNGMKSLAQELQRQGMDDVTLYHPNSYDQQFIADAGGIFDGDYVAVQFTPFEAERSGTALDAFLTWMKKQGSEPTELAMVGWINATLAYEGLLAAGPEFDRDKVTSATNALDDFTAGGLIQAVDWSVAHTPFTQATRDERAAGKECAATVKVVDGEFEVVGPRDKPWECWDNSITEWSEPTPTSFS